MVSENSDTVSSPDRSRAHAGIICTQLMELRPLIARLDRRRRYTDQHMRFIGGFLNESIRVAVVEAGAGFAAHRRATRILIREHCPAWVISAGLSSSLAEDVRPGDLSLATSIRDTHGQQLDVRCPVPESARVLQRPHLVADRHPVTRQQKAELAAQWSAAVADTSSLAVGQVCQETRTRFLSIRGILDGLVEDMPRTVAMSFFEQAGTGSDHVLSDWWMRMRRTPEEREWMKRAQTVARHLERYLTGVLRQIGKHLQGTGKLIDE